MPKRFSRHYRIASLLEQALAPMLSTIVRDGLVTLRGVKMNRDYSNATVTYAVVGYDDLAAVQKKLEAAAVQYRLQLARQLNMRKTPQLFFVYDEEGFAADGVRNFLDDVETSE